MDSMRFVIEYDFEQDGRQIAEIRGLPGVMAYGASYEEATRNVMVLALRVLADRLEKGEIAADHAKVVEQNFIDAELLIAARGHYVPPKRL